MKLFRQILSAPILSSLSNARQNSARVAPLTIGRRQLHSLKIEKLEERFLLNGDTFLFRGESLVNANAFVLEQKDKNPNWRADPANNVLDPNYTGYPRAGDTARIYRAIVNLEDETGQPQDVESGKWMTGQTDIRLQQRTATLGELEAVAGITTISSELGAGTIQITNQLVINPYPPSDHERQWGVIFRTATLNVESFNKIVPTGGNASYQLYVGASGRLRITCREGVLA